MQRRALTVAAGVLVTAATVSGAGAAERLPALNVDWAQVSVSGLSSGGYMAVQVQTAHSADVMGAAVFAGGPYACARGGLTFATLAEAIIRCVNIEEVSWSPLAAGGSFRRPPDVPALVRDARRLAEQGAIDPLSGLADDRVYLFSGTADATVPPSVMAALRAWYGHFVPQHQVTGEFAVAAGHGMITADFGNDCPETLPPFINRCADGDGAGKALAAIYGPLDPPGGEGGRIVAFGQREFVPADYSGYDGLHELGHVFVPESCEDGAAACRLHVVFHGCRQNQDFIGDDYWTRTGYNAHAAANDVIVLYPQTKASRPSLFDPWNVTNPKGCWDWWGYTGQDYLTKAGVQMRAVWAMVQRVAGRSKL